MANISHFTAIRLRVVGAGNLKAKWYSLDEVDSYTMVELPMTATSNKQLTRLSNFMTMQASLRLETDEIDEWFKIGTIIISMRKVFVEFPA